MTTLYNFGAGPGMLPPQILQQASMALVDWQGSGLSILELNHRSDAFRQLLADAEQNLRELLTIPKHYHILFLAGGASAQFAMVPLNLLGQQLEADYIQTGYWSKQAIREARRYAKINIAGESRPHEPMTVVPTPQEWILSPNAAYVHYTANETVDGLEFHQAPLFEQIPVVTDMTSNFLSAAVDIERFGLIYAGAQKNIGPAGMTVVIVRDDLLTRAHPLTPTLYRYQSQVEQHSCINTPPIFNCYVAGLMFAWVKAQGGINAMAQKNESNAKKIYAVIDASQGFYRNTLHPSCRSRSNIVFHLPTAHLEQEFLIQVKAAGLVNLAGHRSHGGIRASLYNAMPTTGVDVLVQFLRQFLQQKG